MCDFSMGCLDEGNGELESGVLLLGLGEDINREGLRKTPLRVAKALGEGTRAVLGKGCRWTSDYSYCESCLLPFQSKCHMGYVPSGQRVVGLSKLSRVADVFAKRLQDPQRLADEIENVHLRGSSDQWWCPSWPALSAKVSSKAVSLNLAMVTALNGSLSGGIDTLNPDREVQERLTRQIAETIAPLLLGGHVIVVEEASHTCMISRGIDKFGSSTTTIVVLGHFSTYLAAKAMFLQSVASATTFGGL
ncbi:hypothetical protein VNO80_01697 [Phaseolus coccineus]|uniref:GTP cyclohydrolase 1 n=1 Tax=Phaseolus coccineus TaxID=3886 RepID=A0AAN9RTF5_PHACN